MAKRFSVRRCLLILVTILMVASILAVSLGAVTIGIVDIASLLFNRAERAPMYATIILEVRLPRVIMASLVGGCLATCGAVCQSLFRNPLADPSLIGVSAGAGLGASVVLFFGSQFSLFSGGVSVFLASYLSLSFVSLASFFGGFVSVLLVYRLASNQLGTSISVMLLAGIAISALAASLVQLLEYLSDDAALRQMSLWRMGSLGAVTFTQVLPFAAIAIAISIFFYRRAQQLNVLLLGESEARYLGINVAQLKRHIIFFVALGIGTSVALVGPIAFVGLIVPHFLRLLIGPDHKHLLPACMLAGACLLVVADLLSRTLIAPTELPIGLLTALIGVPVFISLLRHRQTYGF